jgi:hypothetical protein
MKVFKYEDFKKGSKFKAANGLVYVVTSLSLSKQQMFVKLLEHSKDKDWSATEVHLNHLGNIYLGSRGEKLLTPIEA